MCRLRSLGEFLKMWGPIFWKLGYFHLVYFFFNYFHFGLHEHLMKLSLKMPAVLKCTVRNQGRLCFVLLKGNLRYLRFWKGLFEQTLIPIRLL